MGAEYNREEKKPPVWLLSPKEEKQVFNNWRDSAWKYCNEYVKKFAECEQTAGLGVWFKCKKEGKEMRNCIDGRRQKKYVDEERDKFIEEKMKKAGILSKEDQEAILRDETLSVVNDGSQDSKK
ncbi:hypothetical protein HII13_004297 [Brettanomyces bruxellensis]|uniref:COX assembly mitochondrial protein n=1 Tax=Dekkera bruxellensis TaxID=5007 RepID=A0A7D9H2C9_DEKBR|nr:hypothetical protein HII13_004297 [Brettanomyces bruxellensis]VUG18384.1 DEBR0S3_09384g1_1 [Brettanomyces bruxellensis]